MLYLLAIVFPPLAVLLCGKPFQALFSVLLTLLLWVPGVIHALLVVSNYYSDQRTNRVVGAIKQSAVQNARVTGTALTQPARQGLPQLIEARRVGQLRCSRCGTWTTSDESQCPSCRFIFSFAVRKEAQQGTFYFVPEEPSIREGVLINRLRSGSHRANDSTRADDDESS